MPNSKISALTSATTPLAGTETLPIVQSSTTRQVSVANLTAGRTVSASRIDTSNNAGTGVMSTFSSGWSNTTLAVQGNGSTGGAVLNVSNVAASAALPLEVWMNGTKTHTFDTSGNLVFNISGRGILDANNNELVLFTATASAVNELTIANAATGNRPTISATGGDTNISINLTPKGTGDVRVTTGNLVIGTAGKGIDFSANSHAAGMTSELLTWYEEGTWTPTFTCGTSGTITVGSATGTYTRIGRLVTIEAYLSVSSVSSPVGNLILNGLPFTKANNNVNAISVWGAGFTSSATTSLIGYVVANTTTAYIQTYAAGNNAAAASYVQAGTEVRVTATYQV